MTVSAVSAATAANAPEATRVSAQAKQIGLGFEEMLVNELAQQLAQTAATPDDGSSGDGSDDSSGLMGSDPASTAYAQMIPSVLTSSVMSAGGTGIAQEIAASIDRSVR